MKKTIIAAVIASVVAVPAMADVTISGNVKYKITDTEGATGDWAGALDNKLSFKATEDMGNGMTAFAEITFDPEKMDFTDNDSQALTSAASSATADASDTDTTYSINSADGTENLTLDQKLGLTGSFGTVVMGRMEYLFEAAVSSKMDVVGLEATHLTENGRTNAIGYVSPTVNGFHVAAAGNQDSSGSGLFQNKEVVIGYANGPFSAIVSHADVKDSYDLETLYASYKVGDLSIAGMTTEKDYDDATADIRDNIFRLDYAMGNNKLTLGTKDSDTVGADRNVIKLVHSMSKRTSVYAEHADVDSANSDTTTFGINHNF